ncbi:hypothetical protein ALI144C_14835 [Actinosynnema sp. ALI-1.44]|nr:hypothetical protein [Actinosynnema sp. ALI-1.44]ONI84434.1 hypothetical protein ALI144C_14835 [Actinosynnema sp. ALI-1.44]
MNSTPRTLCTRASVMAAFTTGEPRNACATATHHAHSLSNPEPSCVASGYAVPAARREWLTAAFSCAASTAESRSVPESPRTLAVRSAADRTSGSNLGASAHRHSLSSSSCLRTR